MGLAGGIGRGRSLESGLLHVGPGLDKAGARNEENKRQNQSADNIVLQRSSFIRPNQSLPQDSSGLAHWISPKQRLEQSFELRLVEEAGLAAENLSIPHLDDAVRHRSGFSIVGDHHYGLLQLLVQFLKNSQNCA